MQFLKTTLFCLLSSAKNPSPAGPFIRICIIAIHFIHHKFLMDFRSKDKRILKGFRWIQKLAFGDLKCSQRGMAEKIAFQFQSKSMDLELFHKKSSQRLSHRDRRSGSDIEALFLTYKIRAEIRLQDPHLELHEFLLSLENLSCWYITCRFC